MRTLSDSLSAEQKKDSISALAKIVLTLGEDSYTYEEDRILSIKFPQEPYTQKTEVVLDNSDDALTDIDLQAFKAVISIGATTSEGAEYSAFPPLWVISQTFSSSPGLLQCRLELIGVFDRMNLDSADEDYEPDDDDTMTCKDLLDAIAGDTTRGITFMAAYNQCQAYTIDYDSEDDIIDSHMPKSRFRVYVGSNRLAKFKEVLEKTGCHARIENDGHIHIRVPTRTGTTYNYEYFLDVAGEHTFFAKSYRSRLIIPNKITVKSFDDDDPSYSGSATSAASYALMPVEKTIRMTLASDAEAALVAAAIIARYEMWCDAGVVEVPLNVGQEVLDYIKVTDSRNGDTRTGNIGRLVLNYKSPSAYKTGQWSMTIAFGNWTTAEGILNRLGTSGTELAQYFERLMVKDLYADNIEGHQLRLWSHATDIGIASNPMVNNTPSAGYVSWPSGEMTYNGETYSVASGNTNLKYIYWDFSVSKTTLQTSNTKPTLELEDLLLAINNNGIHTMQWLWTVIDGGAIGTHTITADEIAAGTITADEIAAGTITADRLSFTAYDLAVHDLDDVGNGTSYARVLSTDISAGHILLSEATGDLDDIVNGGTYGKLRLTQIDAGYIELNSLTRVAGEWYNKSGVEIDATHGINIYGTNNALTTRATKTGPIQCYVGSDGKIYAGAGAVQLHASGITIRGEMTRYENAAGAARGYVHVIGEQLQVQSLGTHLVLRAPGTYGIKMYGLDAYLYLPLSAQGAYTNHLYDIHCYNSTTWLGEAGLKFQRGYFTNLPACPVPTSNSALDVIKKIKPPVVAEGQHGERHYFKDADFPTEMKIKKAHKDDKCNVIEEEEGEIEFVRTIGVLVQSVRELTEKVEALEAK